MNENEVLAVKEALKAKIRTIETKLKNDVGNHLLQRQLADAQADLQKLEDRIQQAYNTEQGGLR